MATPRTDVPAVLDARHETRKQMTETLARTPVRPTEEAVIHTSTTTPARAIRN